LKLKKGKSVPGDFPRKRKRKKKTYSENGGKIAKQWDNLLPPWEEPSHSKNGKRGGRLTALPPGSILAIGRGGGGGRRSTSIRRERS